MNKLIKKISSTTLIVLMILSMFVNIAMANDKVIKDITSADEAYNQIQWVLGQGYMGLSLGKFMPNNYVKRNEFTVILAKLNGDTKALSKPLVASFKDVNPKDQFYRYIETEKNYMTSYKSAKGKFFKPLSYITREDAAMSIIRVLGYDNDDSTISDVDSEFSLDSIIEDSNKISPALLKYVSLVVQNELMNLREDGDNNYFDPKNNITRKDLAVLIYNTYQHKDMNISDDTSVEVDDSNKNNQTNTGSNNDNNNSNSYSDSNNNNNNNNNANAQIPHIKSVSVKLDKSVININESTRAIVEFALDSKESSDGITQPAPSISFSVEDPSIVSIDSTGTVKGLKAGSTVIYVNVGGRAGVEARSEIKVVAN